MNPLNYAEAQYINSWLHHPVIGDPSWDSFVREPGNPIYTGKDPMLWSVNGFLFHDPVSDRWYAYIGLYPKGYWPCGDCWVMRENPGGGWEDVGYAIRGDANLFDGLDGKPGATPDVSVVYDEGKYHMIYDWVNSTNNTFGFAYAWAEKPEGPFHRAPQPIYSSAYRSLILGRYKRAYAATLVKRKSDWMVIAMMDSHQSESGSWAMFAFTSEKPEGPYSEPKLLLCPQSNKFHPINVEYYPVFTHDGYVYAPATSVALNRSYQAMFKAPIEDAHLETAWELDASGSIWHSESLAHEGMGIWGQTYSGQVTKDGQLRVLFPCKNRDDAGTISIARRDWAKPHKDGFVISAPNAESYAILRKNFLDFSLIIHAEAFGKWAICWNCNGPLGTNKPHADARPNREMRAVRTELRINADSWQIIRIGNTGNERLIASGVGIKPGDIKIEHLVEQTSISSGGTILWSGEDNGEGGRIELLGEAGSVIKVDALHIQGVEKEYGECWLPVEAIAGASALPSDWTPKEGWEFRYGNGFISAHKEAEAKWNFHGNGFKLHLPKGPEYGICTVLLNGKNLGEVDLHSVQTEHSSIVFEHQMPTGFHAVKIRPTKGNIPCDVLEVIVQSTPMAPGIPGSGFGVR